MTPSNEGGTTVREAIKTEAASPGPMTPLYHGIVTPKLGMITPNSLRVKMITPKVFMLLLPRDNDAEVVAAARHDALASGGHDAFAITAGENYAFAVGRDDPLAIAAADDDSE